MKNYFWATNIRHLRKRKRMSQEDLASELGMSRSKLNAHENGQTRNPPLEDLITMSTFFKISIDSLLKVDLQRLSELQLRELEAGNDVYMAGTRLRVLATTVDKENNENAELVPIKAKAGYTAGYSDPEFIAQLPSFSLPHLPYGPKYRMFPTTGDSMLPIPENAYVIGAFLEDWRSLTRETACIVITKSEGIVFKLVRFQADNRSFLLRSLNPEYPPYEIAVEDVLEIWKFQNYLTDKIPEPEQSVQEMARSIGQIKNDIRALSDFLKRS